MSKSGVTKKSSRENAPLQAWDRRRAVHMVVQDGVLLLYCRCKLVHVRSPGRAQVDAPVGGITRLATQSECPKGEDEDCELQSGS